MGGFLYVALLTFIISYLKTEKPIFFVPDWVIFAIYAIVLIIMVGLFISNPGLAVLAPTVQLSLDSNESSSLDYMDYANNSINQKAEPINSNELPNDIESLNIVSIDTLEKTTDHEITQNTGEQNAHSNKQQGSCENEDYNIEKL